jgi:hypothetical protein
MAPGQKGWIAGCAGRPGLQSRGSFRGRAVAVVGLVLPALIWLGVGSFRSARQLPAGPRLLVRAATVGAVVWAPLLWYFAMRLLLSDS